MFEVYFLRNWSVSSLFLKLIKQSNSILSVPFLNLNYLAGFSNVSFLNCLNYLCSLEANRTSWQLICEISLYTAKNAQTNIDFTTKVYSWKCNYTSFYEIPLYFCLTSFSNTLQMRWFPNIEAPCSHSWPLRRSSPTSPRPCHPRRLRHQFCGWTTACIHVWSPNDQSPSPVQVHAAGWPIRCGCPDLG